MAFTTICGAECGVLIQGSAATTDRHWTLPNALPTIETTIVRSGSRAYRCNQGAASVDMRRICAATRTVVGGRFYLYIDVMPTAGFPKLVQHAIAAGVALELRLDPSDGHIEAWNGTSAVAGPVLTVDTWVGIEWELDVSGATARLKWKVDTGSGFVAQTDHTVVQAATTVTNITLGYSTTTGGGQFILDDIVMFEGTTAGEHYPIGAGRVKGYRADADGTHSNATAGLAKSTGGTTNVWDVLDDDPGANTTDYVFQANIAATEYVELQFPNESTETGVPHAVNVVGAARNADASTTSCRWDMRYTDSGANVALVFDEYDSSDAVLHVFQKALPTAADATAWSQTDFNNVRIRWGYSSDATPDPSLHALILEVSWPEVAGGTTQQGAADIAASGNLTASASVTRQGDTAMAGAATLATAGIVTRPGASSMAGTGALSGAAAVTLGGGSSAAGTGALAGAAGVKTQGAASIAGTGSLQAAAGVTTQGAAAPTGTGSLAALGGLRLPGAASIAGTGQLTGDGLVVKPAAAAFAGSGALTAAATVIQGAAAVLGGTGTLTAGGGYRPEGASSMAASGQLTAAAGVTRQGDTSAAGLGTLQGGPWLRAAGASSMAGTGQLSATGELVGAALQGASSMAGTGSLVAAAIVTRQGAATMTGAATMQTTGTRMQPGASVITGTGGMAGAGVLVLGGAVVLTGTGNAAATPGLRVFGAAGIANTGTLSGTAGLRVPGAAQAIGSGTITATAAIVTLTLVPGTRARVRLAGLSGGVRGITGAVRVQELSGDVRSPRDQ